MPREGKRSEKDSRKKRVYIHLELGFPSYCNGFCAWRLTNKKRDPGVSLPILRGVCVLSVSSPVFFSFSLLLRPFYREAVMRCGKPVEVLFSSTSMCFSHPRAHTSLHTFLSFSISFPFVQAIPHLLPSRKTPSADLITSRTRRLISQKSQGWTRGYEARRLVVSTRIFFSVVSHSLFILLPPITRLYTLLLAYQLQLRLLLDSIYAANSCRTYSSIHVLGLVIWAPNSRKLYIRVNECDSIVSASSYRYKQRPGLFWNCKKRLIV